jgi:hypothetical protein
VQHKSQPSLLINARLLQPILIGKRGFAIKQYFMTQQGQALRVIA